MSYKLEHPEIEIEPGTRKIGNLDIGPYFKHKKAKIRSFIRVPYTVIKGIEKGPTLCITAGVHGTEYAGIAAAIRLSKEINPKDLHGQLLIIHVVNVPAFKQREYICPIDGINIQGIWPGKMGDSISYLIAYRIFNDFISKATHYLDLHGADIHESEIGFSHFHRIGDNKIDEISENMARSLGFKYITVSQEGGEGNSYRVGPEHKIPSVVCELGQGDKLLLDESSRVYDGIINLMRYLKMIKEKPYSFKNQIIRTRKIGVQNEGLFYSKAKPGDIFSKGDILGTIKNLKGDIIEKIHAPSKGIILLMIHNPLVEPGEKIMTWGDI